MSQPNGQMAMQFEMMRRLGAGTRELAGSPDQSAKGIRDSGYSWVPGNFTESGNMMSRLMNVGTAVGGFDDGMRGALTHNATFVDTTRTRFEQMDQNGGEQFRQVDGGGPQLTDMITSTNDQIPRVPAPTYTPPPPPRATHWVGDPSRTPPPDTSTPADGGLG